MDDTIFVRVKQHIVTKGVDLQHVKVTFSVHKQIPRNAQMTTLYTNWSLYITFT